MILHTVKHSPTSSRNLQLALKRMQQDDLLLLMQDGVLAGCLSFHDAATSETLRLLAEEKRLFVLEEDLRARGLQLRWGTPVSYHGFVDLCCRTKSSLAW